MSLPSITHEITVGLGGETKYTRDFVYQYDNATDYFEVSVEGIADLLIFGEGITVTYELMRDGQKILALDEYPCELLLTGGAITKVLCALPSEIRKHFGYWNGQIHLHLGENRKSTDVFVFSSLPGIRPSDKMPGKPSGVSIYFDYFGLKLEAKPSVVRAYQGEHNGGVELDASESDGDVVSAVQGEADSGLELSNELDPIDRLIVLAEHNGKIELESEISGQDAAAVQGEHESGIETKSELDTATSHVLRTEIHTGAETDGFADGRVSNGYFTEYTDENAEALSAEGVTSDVVSAELSGKYAISLEAEATVVTPTPQDVIYTGKYISRKIPIPPPLPTMDIIDADISFVQHEETYTYHGLAVIYLAAFNSCSLITVDEEERAVFIGEQTMIAADPNELYMAITTDDESFTVLNDTEVTAEQKSVFDRYFQLNT